MATHPVDRSSDDRPPRAASAGDPTWVNELRRVTHDLRSPLASISGYADLLHRRVYGELSPAQSRAVESIHRRCDDLGRGLERFSDWIFLESGADPGEPEAIDLLAIAREYAEHLGGDTVHVDAADSATAWAPIGPTSTVVRELLDNAVAAADGHVEVRAQRSGGRALLLIGDDGPGPPDPAEGVRPESGLARTRRWLERMGGRLALTAGEDGGTLATIELPTAPEGS